MAARFGRSGKLRSALAIAALIQVTACTTNAARAPQVYPTREERIYNETQVFIGKPLTAFMQATGAVPYDKYDTRDGRRHFLFSRTRFVQVDYVGATLTCNQTVETVPEGKGGTPDAFRIISIKSVGAC